MKNILKNRPFLWVLTADMLSNLGDMVYYLALLNYVLLVPNHRLALAIVTFSELFPSFMGLVTGYLADRTADKLGTIKLTLIFRVLLYALIGFFMGFEPALWIVVVAAVFNVFSDFAGFYENGLYTPLSLRVVPNAEREAYSAFRQTVTSSLNIGFQALSAILVGFLSYRQLGFLNAGTFLLALIIMQALTPTFKQLLADQPLKSPPKVSKEDKGPGLLAALKLAIQELRKLPEMRLSLVVTPCLNAFGAVLSPILLLLMKEDPSFIFITIESSLALITTAFFVGNIIGSSLVLSLFKKVSMASLVVASTVANLGLFVGMVLHQMPMVVISATLIGVFAGGMNPKFSALMVNAMPEEQLATIGGGVSTYFMLGMSLVRVLVTGLVLLLSADQMSWLFLGASALLVFYALSWWLSRTRTS